MSKEKHFSPRANGDMWRIVETVSGDTVAYAIHGRSEAQGVADYLNAQQARIEGLVKGQKLLVYLHGLLSKEVIGQETIKWQG